MSTLFMVDILEASRKFYRKFQKFTKLAELLRSKKHFSIFFSARRPPTTNKQCVTSGYFSTNLELCNFQRRPT